MTVNRFEVNDGVSTWDAVSVDNTKPHKDDASALREMVNALAPESRIQSLEAFADAADLSDELVAIRIAQLRDFIAKAKKFHDGKRSFNNDELALITSAELMRKQIEELPLALIAVNVTTGFEKRGDFEDKAEVIRIVRQLIKTCSEPRTIKAWESCKELAPFKRRYPGRDTLRGWIKEALQAPLKSGRPKKPTVIR